MVVFGKITYTGGTQELILPDENGLVLDWADVKGLARALKQLVEDTNLRENMGKVARKTALRFSWPQFAGKYLDMLNKSAIHSNRLSKTIHV